MQTDVLFEILAILTLPQHKPAQAAKYYLSRGAIPLNNLLNSRLSIGARLALVAACFAAPIALLLCLFIAQVWKDVSFARTEIAGGAYLQQIWPAFTAATHGEVANFQADAGADKRFGVADASSSFAGGDATARVANGKTLIGRVADGSNLTLDPDLDSFYAMDAATVELPKLLAASVDVGHAADPQARAVALSQVDLYGGAAEDSLTAAMQHNSEGKTRAALADTTTALAAALKQFRSDAAAGAAPSAAALQGATDAAWKADAAELNRLLEARTHRQIAGLLTNLSIVLVALAIGAGLMIAITRGLTGRLADLLKTMDRLIAKDSGVEVPFQSDRNETGRIAATLAAFKQGLIDAAGLARANETQAAAAEAEHQRTEAAKARAAQEQTAVVAALGAGLGRLADGDLSIKIDQAFAADYEALRRDFNAAVERLNGAMGEIAGGSGAIRSGAGEIAQAADNLSRRTEQQAAALEETAAALDQITATVRRTAEGADEARRAIATTKAEADQSSDIVGEAVSAMSQIERSSQEVTQIIGVIDEIAFQTNLLALNAGVEAARAGDAGRGFAVVASEVRALAQRSAEAAKEIKGLISASTAEVQRGVTLVDRTGAALERIAAQVASVNATVVEIAASAREQSTGLQEVNVAVNQMDQMTQQNAAMVEESTAASHSLRVEADGLAEMVGRFRLGGSATRTRTRAAA